MIFEKLKNSFLFHFKWMQYYYVLGIKRKQNSVCRMIELIKYNITR